MLIIRFTLGITTPQPTGPISYRYGVYAKTYHWSTHGIKPSRYSGLHEGSLSPLRWSQNLVGIHCYWGLYENKRDWNRGSPIWLQSPGLGMCSKTMSEKVVPEAQCKGKSWVLPVKIPCNVMYHAIMIGWILGVILKQKHDRRLRCWIYIPMDSIFFQWNLVVPAPVFRDGSGLHETSPQIWSEPWPMRRATRPAGSVLVGLGWFERRHVWQERKNIWCVSWSICIQQADSKLMKWNMTWAWHGPWVSTLSMRLRAQSRRSTWKKVGRWWTLQVHFPMADPLMDGSKICPLVIKHGNRKFSTYGWIAHFNVYPLLYLLKGCSS